MKKIIVLLVSLVMSMSLVGCSTTTESTESEGSTLFTAGTYAGSAEGNNGVISVEVTVDENSITAIDINEHVESEGISDIAFERIPTAIIDSQSLVVDSISTATNSSNGIKDACKNALEEAGFNIESLLVAKENSGEEANHIEKEADVVVIGGGGAGLAAAVTAAQNGASVILVDKMPTLGGNTIISGGGINAVDPELQGELGIEDSLDLHYQQTLDGGDNTGNPELVRILVDNALPAIEWLEDQGLEFKHQITMITGGLHERGHVPNMPLGTGYIETLKNTATELGVEIILDCKAETLVSTDGQVSGVSGTYTNGDTFTITSNSTVLATGGFSANVEMREEVNTFWPHLNNSVPTTNSPAITGDGLAMAEEVNASLINLDDIQLLPLGDPENGSLAGKIGKQPSDFIFINKEGERFVREDGRRDEMTIALLEQTDAMLYIIDDGDTYPSKDTDTNFGVTIGDLENQNKIVVADTIEELATKLNVDYDTLQATIDTYNASVDAGLDEECGKEFMGNKIDKAPYFGCARVPTVHHTMGGVEINTNTEVLDVDGNVIGGLYAAGEVTGGIHGENRLGGNAIADTMVFGRIAGENAATYSK